MEYPWSRFFLQARSSGVERYLDTVEVGGSKPPVPTMMIFSTHLFCISSLFFPSKIPCILWKFHLCMGLCSSTGL